MLKTPVESTRTSPAGAWGRLGERAARCECWIGGKLLCDDQRECATQARKLFVIDSWRLHHIPVATDPETLKKKLQNPRFAATPLRKDTLLHSKGCTVSLGFGVMFRVLGAQSARKRPDVCRTYPQRTHKLFAIDSR